MVFIDSVTSGVGGGTFELLQVRWVIPLCRNAVAAPGLPIWDFITQKSSEHCVRS